MLYPSFGGTFGLAEVKCDLILLCFSRFEDE
jgi:hypothetical protein